MPLTGATAMHYDPADDTLRYSNGAEVPDEAAVRTELATRGLIRPDGSVRIADWMQVQRELHTAAIGELPTREGE